MALFRSTVALKHRVKPSNEPFGSSAKYCEKRCARLLVLKSEVNKGLQVSRFKLQDYKGNYYPYNEF